MVPRWPGLRQVGPQAAPAPRVQARGGLVEEQHPRPVDQRPHDLQPAPQAAGQGAGRCPRMPDRSRTPAPPVPAAVAGRHQAGERPPRIEPVQHRVQPDVLLGGQVEVERGLLEDDAEFPAHLRLLGRQVPAGDPDPARCRGQCRGEDGHRGRLPAPLGPSRQNSWPAGTPKLMSSTASCRAARYRLPGGRPRPPSWESAGGPAGIGSAAGGSARRPRAAWPARRAGG